MEKDLSQWARRLPTERESPGSTSWLFQKQTKQSKTKRNTSCLLSRSCMRCVCACACVWMCLCVRVCLYVSACLSVCLVCVRARHLNSISKWGLSILEAFLRLLQHFQEEFTFPVDQEVSLAQGVMFCLLTHHMITNLNPDVPFSSQLPAIASGKVVKDGPNT